METLTKTVIDRTIKKHSLKPDRHSIGRLIDCLIKDGHNEIVQEFYGEISTSQLLSRSTFIEPFLRDVESAERKSHPMMQLVDEEENPILEPAEMVFSENASSDKYSCSGWDGKNTCPNRPSVLLVTDTDPAIAIGLCIDHQRGDLTKLPLTQVRALPWENETKGTEKT